MLHPRLARLFLLALGAVLSIPHSTWAQSPKEFKGHSALVYGLAFSPDGKLLATAGFDNEVKIWDFGTGKELRA